MANTLRYYHFRTRTDGGDARPYAVLGFGIADAVATLREMLYDGEIIVGWK